jgi:hypothetical protein
MNPTNNKCPNNINQQLITDYRPNKYNYENVIDNNAFRLHLQQNAEKIMSENKLKYENSMQCCSIKKDQKDQKDLPGFNI